MRSPKSTPSTLRGVAALVSLVALLAACGEYAAKAPSPTDDAVAPSLDPESMRAVEVDLSDLSPTERQVLLRAKGRRWSEVAAPQLEAYLGGEDGVEQWLYVWDPATGPNGLRDFQRELEAARAVAPRVAVAVIAPAPNDDLLVALRASQVPYPAYVIRPEVASGASGGPLLPEHVYVTTPTLDRVAYAGLSEALAQ